MKKKKPFQQPQDLAFTAGFKPYFTWTINREPQSGKEQGKSLHQKVDPCNQWQNKPKEGEVGIVIPTSTSLS